MSKDRRRERRGKSERKNVGAVDGWEYVTRLAPGLRGVTTWGQKCHNIPHPIRAPTFAPIIIPAPFPTLREGRRKERVTVVYTSSNTQHSRTLTGK